MKLEKQIAALLLLAGSSTLPAQLSDLPIKAGLWETHVSVNGDSAVEGQACFTAGTTLGDYLTATNKGNPGSRCSVTNKVQAVRGISYDNTCSGGSISSKGRIDVQFPDSEHFSGSSHTTVTGTVQGRPLNMAINKTFNAKFLSSGCGNVKPLVVPSSQAK